jgi:hypothetical protein
LIAHCRRQTDFVPRIGHLRRVTLAGVITTINGKTVSVQVTGGNPTVCEHVGQTLALQTVSRTRYLLKTDTGTVPITFADLAVGQQVSASGTVTNNVWTVARITGGAALGHLS